MATISTQILPIERPEPIAVWSISEEAAGLAERKLLVLGIDPSFLNGNLNQNTATVARQIFLARLAAYR